MVQERCKQASSKTGGQALACFETGQTLPDKFTVSESKALYKTPMD